MAIGIQSVSIYQVVSRSSSKIVAEGFVTKEAAKKARNDFILVEDPDFFKKDIKEQGELPFFVEKGSEHWKNREDGMLVLDKISSIARKWVKESREVAYA